MTTKEKTRAKQAFESHEIITDKVKAIDIKHEKLFFIENNIAWLKIWRTRSEAYGMEKSDPFFEQVEIELKLLKTLKKETKALPDDQPESIEHYEPPIKIDDKTKFAYASELGVIEFLQKLIVQKGVKARDKNLYALLSLITGISKVTIKRMMTFHKDKTKKDIYNNPWNDPDIQEHLEKFKLHFNVGEIYSDKKK